MSKWYYASITVVKDYMVEVEDNETEKDAEDVLLGEVFDSDIDEYSLDLMKPESVDQYMRLIDRDKIIRL